MKASSSLAKIPNWLKKIFSASVFKEFRLPLAVWFIQFVLSEILISGGLYTRSIWLVMVQVLTIICFMLILEKTKPVSRKEKSRVAITNFAVFAILDLLIIYFALESSNRAFYNFYGTWILYAVVGAYPFLNLKRDSAAKIDSLGAARSNQDDLLTKDSYSL